MSEFTIPSNLTLLKQTNQLRALLTFIRDQSSSREDFVFYSDRLIRLLIEEALDLLPFREKVVITPTNCEYQGLEFEKKLCGVSVMRAGESMESGLRAVIKGIRIGKILIQRDPETHLPNHLFTKLPKDISERSVLLLDPLIATGGSSSRAIQVLLDNGVKEENIIFISLISCPEGLEKIFSQFPNIKIVTSTIDSVMNESKYILPGCGDFVYTVLILENPS